MICQPATLAAPRRGLAASNFHCAIDGKPERPVIIFPSVRSTIRTDRRNFLKSIAAVGATLRAFDTLVADEHAEAAKAPVTFGLIADIHHGLAESAMSRLEAFMAEVAQKKPSFIMQLGDFCFGDRDSREFLKLWNGFHGQKLHVLGNHDMDRLSKPAVMDAWGMEKAFYAFDAGAFQLLVLDCNHLRFGDRYEHYDSGNYFAHPEARTHVDPEQLAWFSEEIRTAEKPCLVFTHQGLSSGVGTRNQSAINELIVAENRRSSTPKVVACFCGHHHINKQTEENGVSHLWINSASYHWVGSDFGRMADYRDPLFAFVTLDPKGSIRVEGRRSEFVPPSPKERGYPRAAEVEPIISNFELSFEAFRPDAVR